MATWKFERYELEAFLGEFIGEFDIEAIIDEATELFHGNRIWREGIDLSEICQRHVKYEEVSACKAQC